jgi:hypothetical protein
MAVLTVHLLTPPPPSRVPDIVGVIADREFTDRGTSIFTFEDGGGDVEIDFDVAHSLNGSGGDRTLLMYGVHEGQPWYLTLGERGDGRGCFEIGGLATDKGDHILFDRGLLLPKAEGFEAGDWPRDNRYEEAVLGGFASFCLNESGEVTDYWSISHPNFH